MLVPTREELLAELNELGAPRRTRQMALLGRDTKGSPELRALLFAMLGQTYEATLALEAAAAAGEKDVILRGLRHESVLVRRRAAALACRSCDDDALASAILTAAPSIRRLLLKGVARNRRAALAVSLLPQVASRWGAGEACLLLPACPDDIVRQHLPSLGVAMRSWHPLCWSHPDAVLLYLRRVFSTVPDRDRGDLWVRLYDPLLALGRARPLEVLELALEEAPTDDIPEVLERHLGQWSRRDSAGVFKLLTRAGRRWRLAQAGLPRGVLRALAHFTAEQRFDFARILAESPRELTTMLSRLPPLIRGEVFMKAYDRYETPGSTSYHPILEVLPHALRDREAARILELREIREDPEATLAITALRDIRVARPILERAAGAVRTEDRARALSLLAVCTGLYRRGMTETLDYLARIKDEPDAVRLAVFHALAAASPGAFRDSHVPALRALVDVVAAAADTSAATREAAQRLTVRLLRAFAARPTGALFQFGLATLQQLATHTGTATLPSFSRELPRGIEDRILEALLPTIRAADRPERDDLVIALARSLGRRAHTLEPLQELLEEVTTAPSDSAANQAIELWLAPPRTRDSRVLKLLMRDASTLSIPVIFAHLHRYRQEWLDPYLDGQPIKGRYATGRTVSLLPPASGFHRWLPRQQQALAQLFNSVAADATRSEWERTASMKALSRMPVTEAADLQPYLNDREPAIVAAALSSLAWIDRPHQALPIVLEHTRGDAALVAAEATRRCAHYVEPAFLHAALSRLLATKLEVPVRAELIRLLGAFRSDATLGLLVDEWGSTDLHRDVRIAVGQSARRMLDLEEAWWIVEELAGSADGDVAVSLLDQSAAELRPDHRPRYTDLLLRLAEHPDVRVRRLAFAGFAAWCSGSEELFARTAAAQILDLDHGVAWAEAVETLVASCRDGRARETLCEVVRALSCSQITEAANATTERDLPARQRLWRLCSRLIALPGAARVALRPTFEALHTPLLLDPTLWPLTVHLRISAIEWNEPARAANALLMMARMAPRLGLHDFLSAVEATLADRTTSWAAEALLAIVDHLLEGMAVGRAPARRSPGSSPAAALGSAAAAPASGPISRSSSPQRFTQSPRSEPPPSSQPLDSAATTLAALVLLGCAGRRLAWREDCAERLRGLRQHELFEVRKAALRIWTAAE